MTRVVAVVPAKDRADSVGATVVALRTSAVVDEVLVVDDGSTDETTAAARSAGARVLRLPTNVGKGDAVAAGVAATPEADVYLLVDADTASTAAAAAGLLEPVLDGRADMAIGVLPSAGSRGGFGRVRALAAAGIRRACGFEARAPLSGQRAVRGDLLRSLLPPAPRFGLEVGLTVDAVRAGACVVEVDVAMEHRHTGRTAAGFRHRGRQGVDIVRALWPRLTSSAFRVAAIALVFVVLGASALWLGSRWEPSSVPSSSRPSKVVLFGIPYLAWDDLDAGATPTLDRMLAEGAVAAMSVRTASRHPSTAEGYATVGAATRVRVDGQAGLAFAADAPYEGSTAAEALARRTGTAPGGSVVVVGAPAAERLNRGRHLSSEVGALGSALRSAGKRAAAVGNADAGGSISRPAAAAVMTTGGAVDAGAVDASLLLADPTAPFGRRADPARVGAEVRRALATADVVLVDPGDTERAAAFAAVSTPAAAADARWAALLRTDAMLADTLAAAGPEALVLTFSVTPPAVEWHLAPVVAAGRGVHRGYLHSLSTRREGVVTLTDLAPTVLDALGVAVPDGMIGKPLRYRPGNSDLGVLRELDRDALFRERTYFRLTIAYIVVQALAYLFAILAFTRLGGVGRLGRWLRRLVLGVAAWPLSTFLLRAVPDVAELGGAAVALLLAIDAAVVWAALRARRPLAPLGWIAGVTVAVLSIDVWTGAHLQTSSILGYSLHTAARFTGLGNTAFAVLAATAVLAVCIHVHHAPRRREALVTAAGVCALVLVTDGAPSLGSDVGGILTLVPVFGLLLAALAGRRVSWKAVALAAAAAVAALAVVALVDYLRPADARTHLGRLVADVRANGLDPFVTTVNRKVAANLRTFRSPWTWAVPVITAYLLWMLAWARGYRRLLPPGSAVRVAAVGMLAAGVLGNVVNDSGVVVTALVFVYVGPLLTLLALEGERAEPALLPASSAAPDVVVPST